MTGTINLYNIYIGEQPANTYKIIDNFAAQIGSSDWIRILPTYYYQYQDGIKTPAATSVIFKGSIVVDSQIVVATINDTSIQGKIINAIRSNKFPLDSNGIYSVIFRGDYIYNDPLLQFGWNQGLACGYHATFILNGTVVKYTVTGNPTWLGNANGGSNPKCIPNVLRSGGSPNGNLGADSVITTYAHEMAETITDYDYLTAWYDSAQNIEIADACNFVFPSTRATYNIVFGSGKSAAHFLVQGLWRPGYGCAMGLPVPSSSPITGGGHSGGNNGPNPTYTPVTYPTTSPALAVDLSYHGFSSPGDVFEFTPILFNVFLGEFSDETVALMNYFGSNIGNTQWFNILTAFYYTDSIGSPQYMSNLTAFGGNVSYWSDKRNVSINIEDLEYVLSDIFTGIGTNISLPASSNAVYTVMFRGDFNVSLNGKYWLQDWCSFHGAFQQGLDTIKYVVLGDPSTAPGDTGLVCAPISGRPTANGDLGADSMAVGYAQQLAQVVTDGLSSGWYSDLNGLETGSLCEGDFGPGFNLSVTNSNILVGEKQFLVQSIWQAGVGCTFAKA